MSDALPKSPFGTAALAATCALLAAGGIAGLLIAWGDAQAYLRIVLELLAAFDPRPGQVLRRMADLPQMHSPLVYWLHWLNVSLLGLFVTVAGPLSINTLGAVLAARRATTVAWAVALTCASGGFLLGTLVLLQEPAQMAGLLRSLIARDAWGVSNFLSCPGWMELRNAAAALLLMSWVCVLVCAAWRRPSLACSAAMLIALAGGVGYASTRAWAHDARLEGVGVWLPLNTVEYRFPPTPTTVPRERWLPGLGRGAYDGSSRLPSYARAYPDLEIMRILRQRNGERNSEGHGLVTAQADAPIGTVRPWLDELTNERAAIVRAWTIDQRLWHSRTLGDVHLGIRTTVTLPLTCVAAASDDILWGDIVATCAMAVPATTPVPPRR